MEKINLAYRRKDDLLDGVMLVKTVAARKSSNGGLYLDLTVMDATGEMNAKAWNWQDGASLPPVNTPVRVKGLITEFNGKLQLRIDRIRAAQPEEIVWEDLVPTAPRDPQEMYDELLACAKSLRNEEFSKLAVHLIEEKREKLLFWPAAVSFHHAERSGLLHHTTTMLHAAEALLPIYPYLNRSLLLCGVIVHDLCKMDELGAAEFGIATEYTKEGNPPRNAGIRLSQAAALPRGADAAPAGHDGRADVLHARGAAGHAARRVLRPRARAGRPQALSSRSGRRISPWLSPFSAASTRARGGARWR